MLTRQTSGSVVCPSCGKLVGVAEPACWSCGRRNPGMWGFGPMLRRLGHDLGITQVVIGGCVLLYALSLLLDSSNIRFDGTMSLLAPSMRSLQAMGASGVVPIIANGHWWTLITAGWLHGGLLHILFNMLWVRQLAPASAMLYGAGRTFLIYSLASVTGFALSSFGGFYLPGLARLMGQAYYTVGASAAIFGLLGAIVYAGRRGVAAQLGRQAWIYAVILGLFGLVMPGVDNWAHLGGFVGGYVIGRWFDPLKPEKVDHLIGALAALAITVLALGLALFQGVRFGG